MHIRLYGVQEDRIKERTAMLGDSIVRIQIWIFRILGWAMIAMCGVLIGWILWANKKDKRGRGPV